MHTNLRMCMQRSSGLKPGRQEQTLFHGGQWQDKVQWAQTKTREVSFISVWRETLRAIERWLFRKAVEFPFLEKFKIHRDVMWFCATFSRRACLSSRVGLDEVQRSFLTSTTPWFCDSVKMGKSLMEDTLFLQTGRDGGINLTGCKCFEETPLKIKPELGSYIKFHTNNR